MLEKLFDEIKGNTALVVASLVLVVLAYVVGVITAKYILDAFSLQVVPKDSFVYKIDIEKNYIPEKKYEEVLNHAKGLEKIRDDLTAELNNLKEADSGRVYSQAVCNRLAQEINNYTGLHSQTAQRIQALTSAYSSTAVKNKDWMESDERQAADLRKYAEQLNQQLVRLREDFSKCISTNNTIQGSPAKGHL